MPLWSYAVVNSVFFGTYVNCYEFLRDSHDKKLTGDQNALYISQAGAVGAFAALFPSVPVEVIKTQLQKDAGNAKRGEYICTCI